MTRAQQPVVVFDVFRTLLEFDGDHVDASTWNHLARWLAYRGVRIAAPDLGQRFARVTSAHLAAADSATPDVDVLEVWREVLRAAGAPDDQTDDDFLRHLALEWRQVTTRHLARWPGTGTMLRRAADAGARLAIASNTQRAYTEPELRLLDLWHHFDHVVFSSDVRAAKPDPAVLVEACRRLGVAPPDTVYVGDNPHDDVTAATAIGMPCVLLERGTQPAEEPQHEPTVRIDDGDGLRAVDAALGLVAP